MQRSTFKADNKNEQALKRYGRDVLESKWDDTGKIVSDFVKKPLLEDKVLEAWGDNNIERVFEVFDILYEEILNSSECAEWQNNILYSLGADIAEDEYAYGPILRVAYLDMTLRNAFYEAGSICWFDQEWILEDVPAKFVLCRAIAQFYYAYPDFEKFCSMQVLLDKYEITSVYGEFQILEHMFTELIFDEKQLIESAAFRGGDKETCISNIKN